MDEKRCPLCGTELSKEYEIGKCRWYCGKCACYEKIEMNESHQLLEAARKARKHCHIGNKTQ